MAGPASAGGGVPFERSFAYAARLSELELRNHEDAALGVYDEALEAYQQGAVPRYYLDYAERDVRHWQAIRRARGEPERPFNPGNRRLTRAAAAAAAAAGPGPGPARRHYGTFHLADAQESPDLCRNLAADIHARPLLWPPPDLDVGRPARRTRPRWVTRTPAPHVYDDDADHGFPPFRLTHLRQCFTNFDRQVIFAEPDCLLRYTVELGEGPAHFVIDPAHPAFLMEALVLLTLSTQADIRALFPHTNNYAIMFRVIGDLWNTGPAAAAGIFSENVVVAMPPIDMSAYFRAIRNLRRNITRNEDALRAYLQEAHAFDSLFASIQTLSDRISDAEKGTSMNNYLIRGLDLLVVPIQPTREQPIAAGCARKTRHHHASPNGMVLFDRASTQNNCFFAHALPLLGIDYSVKTARLERERLGFALGEPITLPQAILWATDRRVRLEIRGEDKALLAVYYPDTSNVQSALERPFLHLLLYDVDPATMTGHYCRIHKMERKALPCPTCGSRVLWEDRHVCNALAANWQDRKMRERNVAQKRDYKEPPLNYKEVMGFDVEAQPDPSTNKLELYAVGFGSADEPDRPFHLFGRGAMRAFVQVLLEARPRFLIGWNSRAFDNAYLLPELQYAGIDVTGLVVDGARILYGRVMLPWREGDDDNPDPKKRKRAYIALWDLMNFVPSSLRAAASDFKIPTKKGFFPHKFMSWDTFDYVGPWPEDPIRFFFEKEHPEVKEWLDSPDCPAILNVRELCADYLDDDVRCLLHIFRAVNEVYRTRYETNVTHFMTGPQATYQIALNSLPAGVELEIPVEKEKAVAMRSAYYGGYVQCLRAEVDLRGIGMKKGKIVDVNSLYPAMMMLHDLPHGLSVWMTPAELENFPTDRDFIVDIEFVPPPNIFVPILPYRADGGLLRYSNEPMRGWHPSCKVFLAMELGYRIVRRWRGLIWPHRSKFLAPIMKSHIDARAHARERVNAETGLPDRAGQPRNPAMAQMAKIDANGTYGKFAQKPKNKVTIACRSLNQFIKFITTHHWTNYVGAGSGVIYLVGERYYDEDDSMETKPLGVALFVTAWAQVHLFRAMMIIDPTGLRSPTAPLFYMDTDSIHTDEEGQRRLQEAGLIGDEVGQFSDDIVKSYKGRKILVSAYIRYAIYMRPKCYLDELEYVYADGTTDVVSKIKSKGMPEYVWRLHPDRADELDTSFFYAAILKARALANEVPEDIGQIRQPFRFDSLRNTGLNPREQPFVHRQTTMSRAVADEWTGRRLDPATLTFYPLGYQANPSEQ